MARHDDAVWVLANRSTHGTYSLGVVNVARDVAIGAGVTVGNALQGLPHGALKRGAPSRLHLDFKGLALAVKVLTQLCGRGHQGGVCVVGDPLAAVGQMLLPMHKPYACQTLWGGGQQDITEWRGGVTLVNQGSWLDGHGEMGFEAMFSPS
ncbi:MAG: hypothetical protein RL406_845 [Pseudomonadota bacterium]